MRFKTKHIPSWIPGSSEGLKHIWRFLTTRSADDVVLPRKNLCISIEKQGIYVAYVSQSFSKTAIRGCRKYTTEGDGFPGPDQVGTSAARAIEEMDAEGAEVTLSIPKAWTVIRTAEFPLSAKDNLANAVSYEMDRLTPFHQEDAFFGFRVLKEDAEKITIVLYAAREGLLKRYLDSLRERGVKVGKVTVNLAGIGALLRFMDKGRDSIFLEIDDTRYEGALFVDGFAVEAFTGNFRKDDEKVNLDILLSRLFPYKEVYQDRKEPPHLLLMGKGKNPLFNKLAGQSEGLPITLLDDDFVKADLPSTLQGIPYATIGGALESYLPDGIDILAKGRKILAKTPVAFTLLILLAICALFVYFLIAPLQAEKKELTEIDRQIRARKGEVSRVLKLKDEVSGLEEEVAAMNEFKGRAPSALYIIKEVTENLPQSAWVTTFKVKGGSVTVSGYAESSAGLLSKLEGSPYLKNVGFTSPTLRDRRTNKERFSIKMEVEGIEKKENSR